MKEKTIQNNINKYFINLFLVVNFERTDLMKKNYCQYISSLENFPLQQALLQQKCN
ncbi:unnamed protein product [Paramecium sonneborni]|uniref:Uncharacterized protein n=1 Tax=Paramecium sonneborni TaxID=65129 RepID=A0A8S1RUW8_9CILI|nr:unnamed protein product [Paramecium sonneborni]